jgi:hypothetical protein
MAVKFVQTSPPRHGPTVPVAAFWSAMGYVLVAGFDVLLVLAVSDDLFWGGFFF